MRHNLLVIEDDEEFADYLRRGLAYEGYRLSVVSDAEQGLAFLQTSQPDLIILDVMLPGSDGLSLCRHIRQADYSMPILMLTARDAVTDRVDGLDAGADDYLGKPIEFAELLARIRALLRRPGSTGSVMSFADMELDTYLHEVSRKNQIIRVSHTELSFPRVNHLLVCSHKRAPNAGAGFLEHLYTFLIRR